MPTPQTTPPPNADALNAAVGALAEKGLAKFLTDHDLSKEVVDFLVAETGLPKAVCRFAVKSISGLIANAAKGGGKWLGQNGIRKLQSRLLAIDGVTSIVEKLTEFAGKLDDKVAQSGQLADALKGRRPSRTLPELNALSLDLQAQIRAIQALEDIDEKIEAGFAEILASLHPPPPLGFRQIQATEGARFHYIVQRVPFLGRDKELAALETFLYNERRFTWWLITGPGGMGKSRLALELINRNSENWHAGFLNKDVPYEDWHNWRPAEPTLIVCDYAAWRGRDIGRAVRELNRRAYEFEFPVRFLLIERETESNWWSDFLGGSGDILETEQSRHSEITALALGEISDDDLFRTIEIILDDAGATATGMASKAEILGQLIEIDPRKRPLFAAFLADALIRDANPRRWDRQVLLSHVLEKENDRWSRLSMTEGERALLALATLSGGIELPRLAEAKIDAGLIPTLENIDTTRMTYLSGGGTDEHIAALEPDILGEFFALEHLASRPNSFAVLGYVEAIWRLSPAQSAYAIQRTVLDHPEHRALPSLLSAPTANVRDALPIWCGLAVNLCGLASGVGRIDLAESLYRFLSELSANNNTPDIRIRQAQAAFNMTVAYGGAENWDRVEQLYDDLKTLAAAEDATPDIRLRQAQAAVNMTGAYGGAENWDRVEQLYGDIESVALREGWPPDSEDQLKIFTLWFRLAVARAQRLSTADESGMRAFLTAIEENGTLNAAFRYLAEQASQTGQDGNEAR